jgi:hypothetical protein
VYERGAGPGPLPGPRLLRAAPLDDAGHPRVPELAALLGEMEGLRAALRRDLALAATAVEAGADDLAGWLVGDDGRQIRDLGQRATAHLATLATAEAATAAELAAAARPVIPAPRRVERARPAVQLLAAAAVLGFLAGLVPPRAGPGPTEPVATSRSALQSYAKVTRLASRGASASSISAAAEEFHADLAPLVAGGSDPREAEQAIAMLEGERAVIVRSGHRAALRPVLRRADAMVARLTEALPDPVDPGLVGLTPLGTPPVPTAVPVVPVPSLASAAPEEPDVPLPLPPRMITGP